MTRVSSLDVVLAREREYSKVFRVNSVRIITLPSYTRNIHEYLVVTVAGWHTADDECATSLTRVIREVLALHQVCPTFTRGTKGVEEKVHGA